ncbi:MAG: MMPL family transporter [Gammaproteobacteria bacterium]|nr:MMPL family transporter [Gammaproteobacteria bacterium]
MSEQQHLGVGRRILRKIEPLIYARRWLSMGVLLALTAFFAWEASQIKPDAGFDKLIPLDQPYMHVLKQYERDFGSANTVLVALIQTKQDPHPDIYNEEFFSRLKKVTDAVFFLPGVDRSHVSSLFTPDVRYVEVVEDGFRGGNVVPPDFVPTPQAFAEIKHHVADAQIIGRYVSKDQRGAMIFASLLENDPVTGKKIDYKQVADQLQQLRRKYQDQDIQIHIIGFAKVVGDVIDATQMVVGFFILTLLMTMILLWVYVGSFRLAILPLVCSITAVIWEFGLLRLFGFGLDPFAILVPFLILAVSVSHGVQYVNAWVGELELYQRNSFDASLYTWRRLAIYGTMAIMTDVAGFATIYLIPIQIIQEMAINATLGMLAIIITNKVMMPIWLTWVKIGDVKAFVQRQERRDSMLDPLWRFISNMTRPVPAVVSLLLCGALLGWSLWQGHDLQIGDSQSGVPELLPDSQYNRDDRAINENFTIGTDILQVIGEADANGCTSYSVLQQIDGFAWQIENLTNAVNSTISLPQVVSIYYQAFTEGEPKWHVLPRNKYAIAQTLTQIPPSTGLLNPSCSAMPVLIFMRDHRAATINQVIDRAKAINTANATGFYQAHRDVDPQYCADKTAARRQIGVLQFHLEQRQIRLKKHGASAAAVTQDPRLVAMQKQLDQAKAEYVGLNRSCPVNFALAGGNVGVMAATDEVVSHLEKRVLLYVYIAIVVCVLLSFVEWQSIVCIMLPLALVSWMAYAVMAILGIGMKAATLPVVALAAGIGVDYGIYVYATLTDALASGYKMREAYFMTLKMTGKAVVFTGLTLGLGVLTWLFSGLQFQRDMGKLLVFMFTANMFGAILVLPAIGTFLLKERTLPAGQKPVFRTRH